MTLTLDAQQLVALIVGTAAFLGALAYLIRIGRRISRVGRAIATIVNHELTHNHGTSIKDDVHGIALTVGALSRDFEDFKTDFYHHIAEKEPESP